VKVQKIIQITTMGDYKKTPWWQRKKDQYKWKTITLSIKHSKSSRLKIDIKA